MNYEKLEAALSELPLYIYAWVEPKKLEFSDRVRWICQHECAMYGTTWACPPGVGTVEECKAKCLGYNKCLLISTITEVAEEDWITAVTPVPSSTPFSGVPDSL